MRILHKNNIIDLFVWVDGRLPKELGSGYRLEKRVGRPPALVVSETITILLFCHFTAPQKLLKDIWKWAITNHSEDFNIPCYSKFVEHCHKAIPHIAILLRSTFDVNAPIKLVDSTMLPVCRTCRVDSHRVAKSYAAWGKNHQGWWYGFKLHAACNLNGVLTGVSFTSANAADILQVPDLLSNSKTIVAVGDGGYNARVMRKKIWEDYNCLLLAPPHPKQNKKLSSDGQIKLLKSREKIECVFDQLKNHLSLVTSFPRSLDGYLLNYLRILLGYQLQKIWGLI